MGNMKYQKAVILIVVLLFIAPFVFSQVCDSNSCEDSVGQIDADFCICAYSSTDPTTPYWFPVTNVGEIYRIGENENAFDVVSDGSSWWGCDAEADHNIYGFPTLNGIEAKPDVLGNPPIVPVTRGFDVHQYICYIDSNQERWGECKGDSSAFSNTGGTTHAIGERLSQDPYYYCTSNEQWTDSGITDQQTCDEANILHGGITWTGSKCCGEELGEYYNDGSGFGSPLNFAGCWYDRPVYDNQRVSDTNLVENADFEVDSNLDQMPDFWTYVEEANGGWSSIFYSGSHSYYVDTPSITKIYGIKSAPIQVRPDATYNYSAYIKTLNINGEVKVSLSCYNDWHNENEAIFGYSTGGKSLTVDSDWIYLSGTFSTLATTNHCHLLLHFTIGSTGSAWFDLAGVYEDNPYVLNFGGQFYGCEKTDSDFSISPSIPLIAEETYCGFHGSYFCSYSKRGWSDTVSDVDPGDDSSTPSAGQRQLLKTIIPGFNLLVNPLFR